MLQEALAFNGEANFDESSDSARDLHGLAIVSAWANRWPGLLALGLGILLLFAPASAWAQGGPPLITDDPDTPGPGYWEINLSTLFEKNHRERRFELPRLDLNYGVGRRIQLKCEMPWLAAPQAGQPTRSGAGDSVAGVKWRFLGEEGKRLAWSVYPQLEFNTGHGSVAKGLVEDGRQLLLPTEITLELAHFEINGELGRNFAEHGEDGWVYGVSTEANVTRRLELVGELHGERRGAEPTELVVNVGGRQKLTRQLILMLAMGRAVSGAPDERPRVLLFAGLQINLPGFYRFNTPDGR
jgi:hypothetical protein